ncbi:hypothetical protein [Flavobacterium sp.]|uniref:hypothetical protein n=1 Tax=Flavobacterium sp. TaxID=239 RepID=UPI0012289AC1|nr:hypothetical protein [Flavobacterium sp.]RZJ72880.1 MAG: hypothetical protein EOO49_04400 [Flavobacterium sp.]
MKKLILLLIGILAISCSGDDSNSGKKYLPTAILSSTGQFTLDYDSERRLSNLTVVGNEAYDFTYEGDRVATITKLGGNGQGIYTFTYEGETITAYNFNGQTYPVVYNQPANILNNGIELYENGELKSCRENDGDVVIFTYDHSQKGAWHNGNDFIVPLLIINPEAYQFAIYLSRPALANFAVAGNLYTTTYEPNNRNLPQMAYFVGSQNEVVAQYEYQNL